MNQHSDLWAVVPVKLLTHSKSRLTPLLSPAERARLTHVMVEDVLNALKQTKGLSGVIVVTADSSGATIAAGNGARVMLDEQNSGITAAITAAARHLTDAGANGMLVVPADVPLIEPRDIDVIVSTQRASSPAVTLVRAASDGGTNALLCSPPDAIPFCFGQDSFLRHHQAARSAGIEPQVLHLGRAALDIDRPEDVASLLAAPSATRTYEWLVNSGIPERLDRHKRRYGGVSTYQPMTS